MLTTAYNLFSDIISISDDDRSNGTQLSLSANLDHSLLIVDSLNTTGDNTRTEEDDADYVPDVTTNDDESIADEDVVEDNDPDWSTYYSDVSGESNEVDSDGDGGGYPDDDYPDSFGEEGEGDSLDDFEINDSVRCDANRFESLLDWFNLIHFRCRYVKQ